MSSHGDGETDDSVERAKHHAAQHGRQPTPEDFAASGGFAERVEPGSFRRQRRMHEREELHTPEARARDRALELANQLGEVVADTITRATAYHKFLTDTSTQ